MIAPPRPIADFTDIAEKAGLTMQNVFGGVDTKKYIIETTGTGLRFLIMTTMAGPIFSS